MILIFLWRKTTCLFILNQGFSQSDFQWIPSPQTRFLRSASNKSCSWKEMFKLRNRWNLSIDMIGKFLTLPHWKGYVSDTLHAGTWCTHSPSKRKFAVVKATYLRNAEKYTAFELASSRNRLNLLHTKGKQHHTTEPCIQYPCLAQALEAGKLTAFVRHV